MARFFFPGCIFLFALLLSCGGGGKKHRFSPAFYYWKTSFRLDAPFQQRVQEQGVQRLYLRFFDVKWDTAGKLAFPVSDIRFSGKLLFGEIVPVIYVTNEVMQQIPDSAVPALGEKILKRIRQLGASQAIDWPEAQIDCDWSETSEARYFALLQQLRDSLRREKKTLSATIRLHQVKYFERTGVPPVDRGMLMYYNMGDLADGKTLNSIYDPRTAANYLVNFERYPLPLDLALPWFSWTVVRRNERTIGLLNEVDEEKFNALENVERIGRTHARVKKEQRVAGRQLLPGDILRLEKAGLEECRAAAAQIAPYLRGKLQRVVIFDLQQERFTDDTEKYLEAVFSELD